MYKQILRPLLFSLDSEFVHECFLKIAKLSNTIKLDSVLENFCRLEDPRLQSEVFGINFTNPIGLAAGFDKNCEAVSFFSALGFGFMEIGTVVPKPQSGNARPRIFRLPKDQALINRMGFPSAGSETVLSHFRQAKSEIKNTVLALNIGKNKDTEIDRALEDYRQVFISFYEQAEFFVVNVSSPNTPDLRKLQQKDKLLELLSALQKMNTKEKPILLKIAPDLTNGEIDDVLDCCALTSIAGIVCCNTTFSRDKLISTSKEQGGLSGKPVFERALAVVNYISNRTEKKLPIIAVGGISTSQDIIKMMRAGASLIEIYTSLVYEGPLLAYRLKRELIEFVQAEGLQSIKDIIAA